MSAGGRAAAGNEVAMSNGERTFWVSRIAPVGWLLCSTVAVGVVFATHASKSAYAWIGIAWLVSNAITVMAYYRRRR